MCYCKLLLTFCREDQVPQDHTDQKVLWVLVFLDHRANLVPQDSKDHQGLRELDTISLIELIPQSQAHKARKVKLVQRFVVWERRLCQRAFYDAEWHEAKHGHILQHF